MMKEHKQKTVLVEQCTKLAKNARKHSEAQIKQIMRSIEQFGFLSPIVIDSKGVVHAGNGRLEAARRLGIKEVPAIQAEGLTKDELRLFALADNRIGETSEWDVGILKEEIDDLIASVDLDMASVGFSDDEILALVGKNEPSIIANKSRELDENDFSQFECKCPRCGFEYDK